MAKITEYARAYREAMQDIADKINDGANIAQILEWTMNNGATAPTIDRETDAIVEAMRYTLGANEDETPDNPTQGATAMVYLNAPNDLNANPARGWWGFGPRGATWWHEEGYDSKPEARSGLPFVSIAVTTREYNKIRKNTPQLLV
jgi:hypothetical protein